MKHCLLVIALAIWFISCEKEEVPSHYSFQPEDERWFTNYQVGDTITFVSATAPKKQYVVRTIYDDRKNDMGPKIYLISSKKITYYYYDTRTIQLSQVNVAQEGIDYNIRMSRHPVYNYATEAFNEDTAIDAFFVSVFFNEYNSATYDRNLLVKSTYSPVQYTSLAIDGVTYNEVAYFNSNNLNSYCHSCQGFYQPGSKQLRVSQVWYQRELGIIQFSDLEGNTWKIKR